MSILLTQNGFQTPKIRELLFVRSCDCPVALVLAPPQKATLDWSLVSVRAIFSMASPEIEHTYTSFSCRMRFILSLLFVKLPTNWKVIWFSVVYTYNYKSELTSPWPWVVAGLAYHVIQRNDTTRLYRIILIYIEKQKPLDFIRI